MSGEAACRQRGARHLWRVGGLPPATRCPAPDPAGSGSSHRHWWRPTPGRARWRATPQPAASTRPSARTPESRRRVRHRPTRPAPARAPAVPRELPGPRLPARANRRAAARRASARRPGPTSPRHRVRRARPTRPGARQRPPAAERRCSVTKTDRMPCSAEAESRAAAAWGTAPLPMYTTPSRSSSATSWAAASGCAQLPNVPGSRPGSDIDVNAFLAAGGPWMHRHVEVGACRE